jgi:hypothetical protein
MNFKPASIPDIARGAWQGDPYMKLGYDGRTVVVKLVVRQVEADRVSADPGGAATGRQL